MYASHFHENINRVRRFGFIIQIMRRIFHEHDTNWDFHFRLNFNCTQMACIARRTNSVLKIVFISDFVAFFFVVFCFISCVSFVAISKCLNEHNRSIRIVNKSVCELFFVWNTVKVNAFFLCTIMYVAMRIALAHNNSYSKTRAFHLHKLGGCNENKANQLHRNVECDYVKTQRHCHINWNMDGIPAAEWLSLG